MCICVLFCGLLPCLSESRELRKLRKLYIIGEQIGRGSSGVIRLCKDRITGEQLACKIISNPAYDPRREAEILRELDHPNIISIRASFIPSSPDSSTKYIIMELCRRGSLYSSRRILTEPQAASVCRSLMRAVSYFHSKGIVHRDITLKNILIADKDDHEKNRDEFDQMQVKVADFGIATRHTKEDQSLSEIVGTPHYLAPEILRRRYGKEVDIWSGGVVLYAILSGNFPFFGRTVRSTLNSIECSRNLCFYPDNWSSASESVKSLIRGMLEYDPRKRLTAEQVLNHEWIVSHTSNSGDRNHGFVASDLPGEGSSSVQSCFSKHETSSREFRVSDCPRDLLELSRLLLGCLFL